MKNENNIKVGFSIGDLNGIGSELILKSIDDSMFLDFCTPIIFSNKRLMSFLKKQFNLKTHFHGINSVKDALDGKINVVNVWKERVEINFGEASEEIAAYSQKSLQAANKALKNSEIDVLVNAPAGNYSEETNGTTLKTVSKDDILRIRLNEDFRIANFQSRSLNPKEKLNSKRFKSELDLLTKSLLEDFRVTRPRIAVAEPCWANDADIAQKKQADEELNTLLKKLNDQDLLIYGLYNRANFFKSSNCHHFDALIDFNIVEAEACLGGWSLPPMVNYFMTQKGVITNANVDVDYANAGKDKKDAALFRQAIYTGIDIYKRRQEYAHYSANPLEKYVLKTKKYPSKKSK